MDKPYRILLVDDDEDEYILVREMLGRLPGQPAGPRYQLDWAPTIADALDRCALAPYDIHLVDFHLGSANGLEFLRAAQMRGFQTAAIVLTGQGSYELDLAAMQQGAYDYLLKDQLNPALLERTIRYALERRQAQAELEQRVRERTHALEEANRELKEEILRRTQAERTLRESEERFRALAETTSAAIFIVQDGLIRYANPAARFVTGYTPEELVATTLWRLAHPAYQEHLRESRVSSGWAQGLPARYEIRLVHRSGEDRWVDLTVGEMAYQGRPAQVFTAFDITERDLAEKALRRARDELEERVAARTTEIQATSRRLQAVLQTLPVGIAIANAGGQIINGNEAFQELWDAPRPLPDDINQWPTLPAWWSETGEPLTLRDWLVLRTVVRGESILDRMVEIQTLSGRRKTILYSSVPIMGADGRVAGGVAAAQDITKQRQLEQAAQAAAREAQLHADELEGLHRATAALLSTLDMDELLCQILDAAQSAIPAAEKGMLHILSPAEGQLQARAALGFNDERVCTIGSLKGTGLPARVARDRAPLLVGDTQSGGAEITAGDLPEELLDARSVILAPLYVGQRVLGTLSLSASRPGAFTESNLRLLASFAATTTAALQNAILHAEIKQLAVTDPLTGEYNRRAFFDLGQRELERYQRLGHPLAAVMIDIDHFKRVNDTVGHVAGDQILRELAERARANIREGDIFGRFGGDEFALLLPDTDLERARSIAARIREAMDRLVWETEGGPVPVSVSLGVARASRRHRVLEDLLADADQALYQAKSQGRNRVSVLAE